MDSTDKATNELYNTTLKEINETEQKILSLLSEFKKLEKETKSTPFKNDIISTKIILENSLKGVQLDKEALSSNYKYLNKNKIVSFRKIYAINNKFLNEAEEQRKNTLKQLSELNDALKKNISELDLERETMQINLPKLRQMASWSAEELGKKMGLTRQGINYIEKHKNAMTQAQYLALLFLFEGECINSNNHNLAKLLNDCFNNIDSSGKKINGKSLKVNPKDKKKIGFSAPMSIKPLKLGKKEKK